jgi:cytochrome b subunit of formate dehydrogenase
MATEVAGPVVRNNRRARLLHTACFLVTFVLLFTGWWLLSGHEGRPSVLARLVDEPDVELHRQAGWALAALAAIAVTLGARGALTFVRETVRVNRGDGHWLARFRLGAITGRLGHHRGHFDPGQRLANLAFVATLGTLIGTGIGLTTVHGGPTFVWLDHAHRLATYVLAVLVAGHVLVAVGILPGYRGVWRAMHLGGRVPAATARRLWPETPVRRAREAPVRAEGERLGAEAGGRRE